MTTVLVTLVLSATLCGIYQRFARARQILDTPNERSSHTRATPHGGGVALLTAFSFGLLLAAVFDGAWDQSFVVLSIGALALSILGVIDDLRGLSVRLRLLAYGTVCLLGAAALLHGIDSQDVIQGIALLLIAAFALLWSLNLYNFMDGIDGIAALNAIFVCSGAAYLTWLAGHDHSYVRYCLLLAAAHGGFLLWNFPPRVCSWVMPAVCQPVFCWQDWRYSAGSRVNSIPCAGSCCLRYSLRTPRGHYYGG